MELKYKYSCITGGRGGRSMSVPNIMGKKAKYPSVFPENNTKLFLQRE